MADKSHAGSRAKSVLGGKGKSKSKGGKHPHELHIRRGSKGGFIVRHSHKPDADTGITPEDEEHPISDIDSLHDHVDQAMGDQPPMPAPAPAPAGPAPAPAGPAAGAPPPGM